MRYKRAIRMREILLIVVTSLVTGCVTPMALEDQVPDVGYVPQGVVAISVVDERGRVKNGKEPTYLGKAHASFGIPVDWHVNHIVNTEEGDADKTLAEVLQHRLVIGLRRDDWNVISMEDPSRPDVSKASILPSDLGADVLVTLVLNEWYFSINLNWVSAFNFDTDVDVYVQTVEPAKLTQKNIAERDVIEEQADQSAQNNILEAYRNQLVQVFDDPEIRAAIIREGVD